MRQLKLARNRRRISKTNYKKRLALLKSGKTRLVIRKTNTKLIAQLVDYKPDGDKVLVTACSSELKKLGWKGASKNTTAAYLTGMLAAKRAKDKGVKEAILDIGLHTPTKGSRVFAVAKGALEGGLKVPVSDKIVPDKDRIEGKHLKKGNFSEVISKIK